MYLGLVSTCGDYGVANILYIVQRVMTMFQIIFPIVAIVALVKTLISLMNHPDDTKLKSRIKNWIMAFVFFFIVPVFVDVVISNTDMVLNNASTSDYSVSACWRYAKENSSIDDGNQESSYIKTDQDLNRKKLVK